MKIVFGGDRGVGGLGMIESLIMVRERIVVLYLIEHSLVSSTMLCQKRDFQADIVALRAFSNGEIAVQHLIEFPKGDARVRKLTEHVVAKVDCDGERQDGTPIMGSDWSTLFNDSHCRRACGIGLVQAYLNENGVFEFVMVIQAE
ncbi:uncharacterized protein LOC120117088 isoform X2 [Hibiscus syriacus]|uniref:uncharacterized protein LOC120117088 isoform X2 n=1 Tax=Hibiscus syriacus TaxID=106335 RepID=UPI0019243999|nr:uncharacterized protein LOC120117088 isoform X2 [Hibiscus syriacus]